jgi:Na+/melibiose symporter-like transporter
VLIGKFALALAAGVTLPALQIFQYQPGHPESAVALGLTYALLPLLFKGLALGVLFSQSSRFSLVRDCSRKEST